MKLKNIVKKGIAIICVYGFAMLCVLMMAERVERLDAQVKLRAECNVAMKIEK